MKTDSIFEGLENCPIGTRVPREEMLAGLQWNQDGLIPVVAQDADSGAVLMMAWMNAEALSITLDEKYVCYWSRSRKTLWRKGETSGNRQRLKSLRIDCDGDCVLCIVEQLGPACHTGRPNCFYWEVNDFAAEIISE